MTSLVAFPSSVTTYAESVNGESGLVAHISGSINIVYVKRLLAPMHHKILRGV